MTSLDLDLDFYCARPRICVFYGTGVVRCLLVALAGRDAKGIYAGLLFLVPILDGSGKEGMPEVIHVAT